MKCLSRSALLTLAAIASWADARTPDPALIGCWHAAKIVLHAQDGSRAQDTTGRCALRFTEDQLESTCKTASGTVTTTYRYEIVRPQVYAATMTGSTFRTEMVGSTRQYLYTLQGDQLRTVTAPAAAPLQASQVETEALRTPCP